MGHRSTSIFNCSAYISIAIYPVGTSFAGVDPFFFINDATHNNIWLGYFVKVIDDEATCMMLKRDFSKVASQKLLYLHDDSFQRLLNGGGSQ